jgi:NAD-dependent SIR2 family protein deacetylase
MKLKMTQIVDYGTHASEKVLIDVLQEANLQFYIVRDTTYYKHNTVSNEWVHAHKFMNQAVKKGDKVILYTKKGDDRERDLGNGNKEYIYYWGLGNSVWNNDGDAAALYEVTDWQHLGVNKK